MGGLSIIEHGLEFETNQYNYLCASLFCFNDKEFEFVFKSYTSDDKHVFSFIKSFKFMKTQFSSPSYVICFYILTIMIP